MNSGPPERPRNRREPHAGRIHLRPLVARPIRPLAHCRRFWMPAVLDPLPDITAHVVQAEAIGSCCPRAPFAVLKTA